MINTLKLAHRLEDARMSRDQAEAVAEGLDEALRDSYVTREYLDSRLHKLTTDLTWRFITATFVIVGLLNGALFWGISLLLQQHKGG